MKDSIAVKDLLDYCERGADICQKLHHDALERYGTTGNASDINAMAYFMQRENMLRYEMTNIVKTLASMDEQPEDCIFGYGTCCYPIEECQNCPNRNGGTNY